MSCHICGHTAIGLCRQCFKFYCQEHGDGFCSSCQQQGWELEHFTGVIGRDVARRTNASSLTISAEQTHTEKTKEQETSAETEGEKSDIEKQSKDGWRAEYHQHWLDQEKMESLTEPAKFVSLLPIFGASRLHDVLMLLKGIELYEEAFAFDLSIAFGSSSDNGMTHRHPSPLDVTIRDDVSTAYNLYQRGGGGSERAWTQHFLVTPVLNPTARQLTLEVPRLQIMEHIFRGRRRMPPEQTFLNGPWIISCTVPDERISP